jgi:integrase
MPRKKRLARGEKPRENFPLWWHEGSGQWAKKFHGRRVYFGTDADKAEAKYLDEKEHWQARRDPRAERAKDDDTWTVRELCNRFLAMKRSLVDSGELSARVFADYLATCERIVKQFRADRPVEELRPEDFVAFRAVLAKGRSPSALVREITQVRMVMKFALELTDRRVKMGTLFRVPSAKVQKLHRQQKTRQHGRRMIDAPELSALIAAAPVHLKAMIYLGINCGLGQTDCSRLPVSAIDFDKAWLTYPRPKTAAERECPLWPETVDAIRASLAKRPADKSKATADLVFLTRLGNEWVHHEASAKGKVRVKDSISLEFGKLLKKLALKRHGINFYALRHTFETIGGDAKDQIAVDFMMGHASDDMAGLYRELISGGRLTAVTDHVRAWLRDKGGTPVPQENS